MSESPVVDPDDFTTSALLAARFNAMINGAAASRPASVRQLLDPRASVTIPTQENGPQEGSCLPMLQAAALYLHFAAQVDDDAREVFATVEAGFTGLPIESDFVRVWLGHTVHVIDDETGSYYTRFSDEAITEAVYEALLSIDPEATLD